MATESTDAFHLVPFLDRVQKLLIGSAYFQRFYHHTLRRYVRQGAGDLLLDLSITNGEFLADPYADAEIASDGCLNLYWRCRRHTTRPSMTVKWAFSCKEPLAPLKRRSCLGKTRNFFFKTFDSPKPCLSVPFGSIFDFDHLAFEMTRSMVHRHRYTLFRYNSPGPPMLEIVGKHQLKAMVSKHIHNARTSIVFKVYESKSRHIIATIEPAILNTGGLLTVTYKSTQDSREMKGAILGVALLLCLRYYMKEIYFILQRKANGKRITQSI